MKLALFRWPLLSILIFGLCSTGIAYLAIQQHNISAIEQQTYHHTNQLVDLAKERFNLYEYGLLAARGAVIVGGAAQITRQQFERYINSRNLSAEFPGALGFGYIRRVPVVQEAAFLARARADGKPGFTIRALTPHDEERFVIEYIYPETANQQAIGLDIGSEVNRRAAAINAALSGNTQLTAPITLVQAEGAVRHGFLILLPVYAPEAVTATPADRLNALIGWAYAPLVVVDVLNGLEQTLRYVSLTIADQGNSEPFFQSNLSQDEPVSSVQVIQQIEFKGRSWQFTVSPTQELIDSLNLWSTQTIIQLGLLLTLVSMFIAYVVLHATQQATDINESASDTSIIAFLRTSLFKKSARAYAGTVLLVLLISTTFYLKDQLTKTAALLSDHADFTQNLLTKQQQNYTDDLMFLKSTPALLNLQHDAVNINRANNLTTLQVQDRQRFVEIAKAYMLSSSDVFQVRLLDLTGHEQVRVERKGPDIIETASEKFQYKGDRPYFIQTIKLSNNGIYVSDIEPNMEYGVIEQPIRPTQRFSTPLYDLNNRPIGILVINTDPSALFDILRDHAKHGEFIYLSSRNNDFVLSPQAADSFSSSRGTVASWSTFYQLMKNPLGLDNNAISAWRSDLGNVIAASTRFTPNPNITDGALDIRVTYLLDRIHRNVLMFALSLTATLIAAGCIGSALMFANWVSTIRKEHDVAIARKLQEKKNKDLLFESITELSPEAMVISDIEGTIVLVNSQAETLFGYHRTDMLGNKIDMFIPSATQQAHKAHMDGYIKNPRNRAMGEGKELLSIDAFGQEFPVEVSLSPIKIDNKLLIASSVRNISERRQIEHSLKSAIAEAKRASNAKSAFLANMSHEIRTPLNAVIGLTHLLKEAPLLPEQEALVSKIALAGRSLLSIVNDVLDLAKIEANEVNIKEGPCQLRELLHELHSVFASQAKAKGLTFSLNISEDTPACVQTDAKLLQQILTNLLGNALKFTQKGSICLQLERLEDDDLPASQCMLRFSVKDSGIGISKAAQQKIFLPFNQEDDNTNRRFGGTGLGLSIVSNLSAILRGNVGVNSEPDNGSEFWLQLPVVICDDATVTTSQENDALLVMLAEDNLHDKQHIMALASALGWHVEAFDDGEQLLQAYQNKCKQNLRKPDVLILDWQMPHLDGIAVINTLCDKYSVEHLPAVLMISAFDIAGIKPLDVNHAVNTYLHKPFTSSALFNAVHEVVAKHTGNNSRVIGLTKGATVKAKWLPGVKVLVVDDSQINLDVVTSILQHNGADVATATSGKSALDYISQHQQQLDIVLMDVQMPEMDGLEATTLIRKALKLTTLPVIALTAGTMEQERKNALAAGMDDFLTKPIEPVKLVNAMRKAVEKYRGTSLSVNINTIEPPQDNAHDWPFIRGLTNSASMFQGNKVLFTQSLQRLINEYGNWHVSTEELAALTDSNKRTALASKIHKLRGSAGLLGAKRIFELSAQIENQLRKTENDVSAQIIQLVDAIAELQKNCAVYLSQELPLQQHALPEHDIGAPLTDAELQLLIKKLGNNSMAAADEAKSHRRALFELLGEQGYALFFQHLDDLQFKQAAELLKNNSP